MAELGHRSSPVLSTLGSQAFRLGLEPNSIGALVLRPSKPHHQLSWVSGLEMVAHGTS